MKIIFMGTPDFAVPTLRRLVESNHDVIAVVTQPDRPKGRGKAVLPTPIKKEALKYHIPVHQPERVREEHFLQVLADAKPDIIVVVAFGQILPKAILDQPPLGCVNLHASLLPKYRGAAPIERAMMEGDEKTGNTTMLMDAGLDSGDILLQEEMEIPLEANASLVYSSLSQSGANLILRTLEGLESRELQPKPQTEEEVTLAPRLKKEDGLIHWDQKSSQIANLIRALVLRPVAYTFLKGLRLKIWSAESSNRYPQDSDPGRVVGIDCYGIYVSTKEGNLLLKEIQAEGKKRMNAFQFVQGHRVEIGESFSESA